MPKEKAKKLKHEGNGWDKVGQQFVVDMSCAFTDGTGVFEALTVMEIHKMDKVPAPETVKGEVTVKKTGSAPGTPAEYVRIEPIHIDWDPKGYSGPAKTVGTLTLRDSAGNDIGDPVSFEDRVDIR